MMMRRRPGRNRAGHRRAANNEPARRSHPDVLSLGVDHNLVALMAKPLFSRGDLDPTLNATLQTALKDVERWDEDQLLGQSEGEIVTYLVGKHSVRPPVLGEPWIEPPADTKQQIGGPDMTAMYGHPVEVCVTRVVVHVPIAANRSSSG